MKQYIALLLALILIPSAQALDSFKITAVKKTAHERESAPQDMPRGSSTYETKYMTYEFGVTRSSTAVPEACQVQWIVFVEEQSGRVMIGTRGNTTTNLPYGQNVAITTDTFKIEKREWSRGATVEDKILGYALRILDQNSNLIFEEYQPQSLQQEAEWRIEEQQKDKAQNVQQPPPKRRRPLQNFFKNKK